MNLTILNHRQMMRRTPEPADSSTNFCTTSVTSPHLYMNQLLSINNDSYFIHAFADDLALVAAGRVRKEPENNTNNALNLIADKLTE
ncbi:hypothetical protein AVEN_81595-1 [Araneus ventricosus]|uniref:Reverse transcriptase domain-containing protein n=1 Tax=Araneus ventricosus TaxID=182803 RepID=A0A4Y2FT11_ARAVE|nr:hypothetical protein AVEN_81595-1 [Araneus ventricosus]